MDIAELIPVAVVLPLSPPRDLGKIDHLSEEQKKQVAKDFEAVFINKLLEEMENTIGEWGFEKDGASRQVRGIFGLYLSQHIANNGGFGLWKEIYKSLTNSANTNTTVDSLDEDKSV